MAFSGRNWQKQTFILFLGGWGGGGGGGGQIDGKEVVQVFLFNFFVFLEEKKTVLTQVRSKFYQSYTEIKPFATIIRK